MTFKCTLHFYFFIASLFTCALNCVQLIEVDRIENIEWAQTRWDNTLAHTLECALRTALSTKPQHMHVNKPRDDIIWPKPNLNVDGCENDANTLAESMSFNIYNQIHRKTFSLILYFVIFLVCVSLTLSLTLFHSLSKHPVRHWRWRSWTAAVAANLPLAFCCCSLLFLIHIRESQASKNKFHFDSFQVPANVYQMRHG